MGSPAEIAVNPFLYPHMSYDPASDLTPVTLVGWAPLTLVLHPAVPAVSVAELIALAKARPGELTYASPGNGTAMHLAGEYFKTLTGVEMVHVPYRGGAPPLADEKVAAW